MTPHSDGPGGPRSARAGRHAGSVAPALAALVTLGGVALLVSGAVEPVAARFSGSTDNTGSLMRTASVDLELADGQDVTTASLAVDASNLVPGDVVERCLTVRYRGSADDVDVRLTGRRDGGSGLEAYLVTHIESGTGVDPACGDFVGTAAAFDGVLDSLWSVHGTFDRGVPVLDAAGDGTATTLRVTLELADDDRAQGLDTGFWLVMEARP